MNDNFYTNGFRVFRFENINSTNAFIHDKIVDGQDVTDFVAVADHQTAGKGMGENRWESEAGKNLLFSLALDVSFLKAEEQFGISQAVAVAISSVVKKKLVEHEIFIKWPNDIYVSERKLAGILIQNTLSGMMMQTTVIGVGLNVNQMDFSADVPNPVSLKMLENEDVNLDALLIDLLVEIKGNVESLRTESGKKHIDDVYKNRLFRFGKWADYEYESEVKSMIINGYDKFGRLCLSDKNGRELICDVKEIRFIM